MRNSQIKKLIKADLCWSFLNIVNSFILYSPNNRKLTEMFSAKIDSVQHLLLKLASLLVSAPAG